MIWRIVLGLLIVLAAAFAFRWVGVSIVDPAHVETRADERRARLDTLAGAVTTGILAAAESAFAMQNSPLVAQAFTLADAMDADQRSALLQGLVTTFFKGWGGYVQVHLIDLEGHERLRLDAIDGEVTLAAEADLEDLSDRSYVREGLSLSRGGLFISELDPNVEQGAVELPVRPMLRFVTRVDAPNGDALGLFVVNLDATSLLAGLELAYEALVGDAVVEGVATYLVNASGDVLLSVGGRAALEPWAWVMDPQAPGLDDERPDVWRVVQAAPGTWQRVADEIVLDAVIDVRVPSAASIFALRPLLDRVRVASDAPWHFVSIVPVEQMLATSPSRSPIAQMAVTLIVLLGLVYVVGSGVDSARLERAARRATESERAFRGLFEHAPTAYLEVQADGFVARANAAMGRLLHREPADIVGASLLDVLAQSTESQRERAHQFLSHAVGDVTEHGPWVGDRIDVLRSDGVVVPVAAEVAIDPMELGVSRNALVAFTDASRQEARERELLASALLDPLTGALNRRGMEASASTVLARAHVAEGRLALLALDLDHFKLVNDTFGHASGDDVLRSVATCVRGVLRDRDLFARFGGEEFLILVADAGPDVALEIAERLRERIEREVIEVAGGQRIPVTTSIGVANYRDGDTFASLLERADRSLYEAKRQGRNRVVAEPASGA